MIIDDDSGLLDVVQRYFEQRGYDVVAFDDQERALAHFDQHDVDLVLLDVHMPGINGFEVCRRLRRRSDVPIIFLTADTEPTDLIVGLELGGDDYVTKPFWNRELESRITARLRESGHASDVVEPLQDDRVIMFEGWQLDVDRHELTDRDGKPVMLTSGEFKLLKCFVEHPNRVLSRDQLMDFTRGHEANPFDRSIDVLVGRLRKKLGDEGPEFTFIKTMRGEGYLFVAKVRRLG